MMSFWDYQGVAACRWKDIEEGVVRTIFEDLLRRNLAKNYLAEDAVGHGTHRNLAIRSRAIV